MNICKDCTYMRRGRAIDRRAKPEYPQRSCSTKPSAPPPAPRGRRQGGDFICSRHPIVPARVDPQTGFQAQPSGEDCRDLNPAGECEDFVPGMSVGAGLTAAIVASALIVLGCLLVLAQG